MLGSSKADFERDVHRHCHCLQARGDQMVWLKRHEQVQLGHTALVCVMDSLLKLQEGIVQHPHPHQLLMLLNP